MAKKKRFITEDKEEEYEFTPSEFDEREFILSQMYSAKVLFIVIVLAIIVGTIASVIVSCLGKGTTATIVDTLLVFFMAAAMMRLLVIVGVRVDLVETRAMLGNILIYLVMALGVCVLLINTVFSV